MNKNLRRAAQLVVLALLLAAMAFAQAPMPASANGTTDLLEVLRTKGILSQQEYDALKQRIAAAPAPATAQEVAPMPAEHPIPFVTMMDSGIGMHVGQVDVKFSGEINAFYVHDRAANNLTEATGGLATNGTVPNSSLREGLLPSYFSVSFATRQKGFDVGAYFSFCPGINSTNPSPSPYLSHPVPTAFSISTIDVRQNYATIGNKKIGTFKFGRDIGMFGEEAILNDMTILAVGTPNGNVNPGSVSLGRIGVGYIYTDFQPQISYQTPSLGGLTASFGIMQPLNTLSGPTLTGHGQPMFQAKLAYALPGKGPAKVNFWLNGLTQSLQANLGEGAGGTVNPNILIADKGRIRETAFDGGAKVTFHDASIVAYGYNGRAIGTEAQLLFAVDATGHPRMSRGGYLQGTYTFAKKLTLGGSWGISHLSLSPSDGPGSLSPLLRSNYSDVAQVRYSLTQWATPIAEYTHTVSSAHSTGHVGGVPGATEDSVALGTIFFF